MEGAATVCRASTFNREYRARVKAGRVPLGISGPVRGVKWVLITGGINNLKARGFKSMRDALNAGGMYGDLK